jgi:ATP-binding cassette subfamily C (CFTR/MRP) protein 4
MVADTKSSTLDGYLWALYLFLSAVGQVYCVARMNSSAANLAIKVKSALAGMIYRKALRLKGTEGIAQAVDLINRDLDRFKDGFLYFHYTWGSIPELLAVLIFLGLEVGIYMWPCIIIVAVAIPLQVVIGYYQNKYQMELEHATEGRVGLVAGILDAMKIVKYNGWENYFSQNLEVFRDQEKKYVAKLSLLRSLAFMISFTLPVIVSLAAYCMYFLISGIKATAVTTFTVLSISNALRYPLFNLPTATKASSGMLAAIHNVKMFLIQEEVGGEKDFKDLARVALSRKDTMGEEALMHARDNANISAKNASFMWGASLVYEARKINFSIPKGPHLMAVIGPLAAGKSSLVAGITQQLQKVEGECSTIGRYAFASQQPFVFSNTIRENILFGQPYNAERYEKTIFACSLTRDLELFPDGDLTMLAERGTNLSGGQRQRVNLARAVYSDRELVILDDQLSALDQKVNSLSANMIL